MIMCAVLLNLWGVTMFVIQSVRRNELIAVESVKKGLWALSNLWRITVSALQSVRNNCLRYAICEKQLCLLGHCKEWINCCWIYEKWLSTLSNLWGITMSAICEERLCLLGYCKEWVDCCWICDKWLCGVWNLWGITMHVTHLCYTVTAVRKQWDNCF